MIGQFKLLFLFLYCSNSFIAQIPRNEDSFGYDIVPEMPIHGYDHRGASVYYKDGKSGLVYKDSNITEAIFDKAYLSSSLGIIVKKDGKFGFYNRKGLKILSLNYDSISHFGSNSLKVFKNLQQGIVDKEGNIVLSIKYKQIFMHNSIGMFAVRDKKDRLNIVGKRDRKIVTSLETISLHPDGAIIGNGKKYGFITNSVKTKFIYDFIPVGTYKKGKSPSRTLYQKNRGGDNGIIPSNGSRLNQIVVVKEGKVGMVDSSNNLLIPIEHDEIFDMRSKNYYAIKNGKKFGYYLKRCSVYESPKYDGLYMDGTTYLKLILDRKHGIVDDATGKLIIPIEYESIIKTKDSFKLTKDNKQGAADMQGTIIVPVNYDKIESLARYFSSGFENLFKVTIGEKTGVIDYKNKVVIPVDYEYVEDFEDDFFLVVDNKKFGLFSKKGELLQELKFDFIERAKNERAIVFLTRKEGLTGMLNSSGREIYRPQFKEVFIVPDSDQDLNRVERYEKSYFVVLRDSTNMCGLFDLYTGKFAIPIKYDNIYQHTNREFYLARQHEKFGVLSVDNKVKVDFIYDTLSFSKTYIFDKDKINNNGFVAKRNGLFGVINLSGDMLVPFEYTYLEKLSYKGLYKAKKENHFVLINQQNEILNKGPFDNIADYEQHEDEKNEDWNISYINKALTFYEGNMREIDENGKFLTEPIKMFPHQGFSSLLELKSTLISALNSTNDSLLYLFSKKIAPSPHLVYLIDESQKKLYNNSQYLHYESIYVKYYQMLLKFKYYIWNSEYYNKKNLLTDDYTVRKRGIVTNSRSTNWAYGDTKYLEKILRNAIKINGYWISSYYLSTIKLIIKE
jgi:hypothetical protein